MGFDLEFASGQGFADFSEHDAAPTLQLAVIYTTVVRATASGRGPRASPPAYQFVRTQPAGVASSRRPPPTARRSPCVTSSARWSTAGARSACARPCAPSGARGGRGVGERGRRGRRSGA